MRKETLNCLNIFLKSTDSWTFEQKKDFINLLFPIFETIKVADYGDLSQPLKKKLVKTTFFDWCKVEQKDNNTFCWYGKYFRSEEYLLKVIELDGDLIIIKNYIDWKKSNHLNSINSKKKIIKLQDMD